MLTGYVLGRGTGAQEPDGDEPVHRPGPQDCPQAWRREEDRLLFLQPGCLHHVRTDNKITAICTVL